MIRPLFAPPLRPALVAPVGDHRTAPASPLMPRLDEPEPCGGQSIIDLALCLILAVAVVGLLLLALP